MLHLDHHGALILSYGTAVVLWLACARWIRPARALWPAGEPARFDHPWREVGLAFLAVLGVIGVGQLYQRSLLIPVGGNFALAAESLNQILIFSPMLVPLLVRRQGLATAWLPLTRVWARLGVGIALALGATAVFTLTRDGSDAWPAVVTRVLRPAHIPHAVQVLMEDISIAIVLARLGAALAPRQWLAVVITAGLFAGAHLPAMISRGDFSSRALALLGPDALLGVLVLGAAQRSRDLWWVWCVHFAMDMMQFEAVRSGG